MSIELLRQILCIGSQKLRELNECPNMAIYGEYQAIGIEKYVPLRCLYDYENMKFVKNRYGIPTAGGKSEI